MAEWQSIESAPNDLEVLVWTAQWGAIIARHDEEHGAWLSRMQVPVTLGEEDRRTHWCPLPEPPEGQVQQDRAPRREKAEDRPA